VSENLNVQFVPVYGYWVVYEDRETGAIWDQPVVAIGNTDEYQEEMSAVFYTLDGDGGITPVLSACSINQNITLLYEKGNDSWERTIQIASSKEEDPDGQREIISYRAWCYHKGYGEEGKRRKEEYNKIFEEWEKRKGVNVESSRD
tara:strand:- start:365 stop:802 length:438 start_codon:yes stop_codon:yes gene_type:complete